MHGTVPETSTNSSAYCQHKRLLLPEYPIDHFNYERLEWLSRRSFDYVGEYEKQQPDVVRG
uniref:Uncharacterized protein n=1 Tax=Pseudomonas migulae TaxID=78543 RepID=R4IU66_9PSED|nr:hypothetical protein pD2RT_100 [Pseudomonas migulae]